MQRVVVIGAGHLGSVIATGLSDRLPGDRLAVVEVSQARAAALSRALGTQVTTDPGYRPEPADLVVLAIPPQAFPGIAAAQAPGTFTDCTVVSVMAGVDIPTLSARLGTARVVRVMPNTAAAVHEAMTVLCPGRGVARSELAAVERVLTALGRVATVHDESLMDAATAVCGGGPAFLAYVAEAFTDFAEHTGFTTGQARVMAAQLLRGTAGLLESGTHTPRQLYRQVMTPGGTTERGMSVLQEAALQDAVRSALARAAHRAGELRGGIVHPPGHHPLVDDGVSGAQTEDLVDRSL
ncbi:pyrroline-5-carboxylate reductase [Streptomyces sp. NPDC051956]|uniref:pyrroline-5-carboxylate reductase n=1 Tax=Streptomyces sp. NPDC051956 TaxID=3365677 RepID=UPI0037D29E81